MAQNLFWFYDAFVLGAALIALYCGVKRGLLRTVVLVVMTALSLIASWLLSTVASPVIYENFIQPRVSIALSDASSKTDPVVIVSDAVSGGGYGVEMTDDEVRGIMSLTGDFFSNIASEIRNNGAGDSAEDIQSGVRESVTESMLRALVGDVVAPSTLREILESVSGAENKLRSTVDVFLNGNSQSTAETVEQNLVGPAVKSILRVLIWIISMFILTIITRVVSNAFENVNKIPIIGPVNAILGGALGLAEGMVLVYVLAQLVRLVCYATSNSLMFLNTETVQKTYVFRHLFYFDITSLFDR